MNTGERPVSGSIDTLPSLMKEVYNFCRQFVKDKEVLDVGCGEGYVDMYLCDLTKHITGIDKDKKVIESANKNFASKGLAFINMSGEKLEFSDNSFDIVISSQSIEHMKNDVKFLCEVHRVLRDNGIFICTTPNKLALVPPGEKIYQAPFYPFHFREYMPEQFYGLLGKYFTDVKRVCFYNPVRSLKLLKSSNFRFVYRISRFKIIWYLGKLLPLRLKRFILFFRHYELASEDAGTAFCGYNDNLGFVPEVLCGICRKSKG